MAGISPEARERLHKQLEPFASSSIMNGKNMIEAIPSQEEQARLAAEWEKDPGDFQPKSNANEVTLQPGEIDAMHKELNDIGSNGAGDSSIAAEVPAVTATATIEEPPAAAPTEVVAPTPASPVEEIQTPDVPEITAPEDVAVPSESTTNGAEIPAPVSETPVAAEPNGSQPPTEKKQNLWSKLFGKNKPAPTENPTNGNGSSEAPAEPVASVEPTATIEPAAASDVSQPAATPAEAPLESAPLDTQKLTVEFNDLLNSGTFDQLLGNDADKKALMESFAPAIMAAKDVKALRSELVPKLLKMVRESGRFKSKDELAYVAGKTNELMNRWLGEDSSDGTIFFATGGSVAPGDKEYERYKNPKHEKAENRRQERAVSKIDEKIKNVREQAGSTGKVTLPAVETNTQEDTTMTNETEATEGVGPVVEATPETTGEAPVVESPMGETEGEESVVDSGAQAPAIEVPEVTQEPAVESESASPVAENAESETTAQESSEVQNTQESSANGEMSSEERAEKFRRIDEVATKLDDGVKDSFKGLTPEQIQMLADVNGQVAELAALTDLTEDEINKIDNLTSKAEVAFSHHIDYLKNQRDDTWDVRAQKLSDFLKMLSLEDWESDEQSEEGRKRHEQVITGILGPRERMSKHRVQAIDWRKRSMEASGATYKQDVEKKVAQNKEAIVNNVMSALDKTAELVANVSTVGDRARRTREVLLNKALNVGDNLNRAGDFSVNFLGNVLDIYYGLGVAALPAARAAGAEVMLGVGKVGETINTQVETSVKNGIDYMVAQLQRMRENARQRAERAEAARQERINELKKTANSLSEASEKYRADADKAKGLRGWIRGLVAR